MTFGPRLATTTWERLDKTPFVPAAPRKLGHPRLVKARRLTATVKTLRTHRVAA